MSKKFWSLLYSFDLIGIEPELLIFKDSRNKTVFSSILSIIILFSIIFCIVCSIDNDISTKIEIFLNNIILMLQLIESKYSNIINDSIDYYEAQSLDNETYDRIVFKYRKM